MSMRETIAKFWGRTETKSAPAVAGAMGHADVGYVDTFGTQRVPSTHEQLQQYKDVVYTCSSINASAVAAVPYHLYASQSRGQKAPRCGHKGVSRQQKSYLRSLPYLEKKLSNAEEVHEITEHPILTLLSEVNEQIDGFELFELTDLYMELAGTAFWYVVRGPLGVPAELWLIPTSVVRPFREPITGRVLYWLVGTSQQVRYELDELLVFRFPNPSDPYGMGRSPARAAWENVELRNKSTSKALATLDNNARPDIVFSPTEYLGPAEANNLEKRLQRKFSKGKSGGVLVAESGLKPTPLNYSPRDLEMLQLLGVSEKGIANAYGVPMSFLKTEDVNRANAEAGHYQHAKLALFPRVTRLGTRLTSKFCPLFDPSGRLFIAFDNPIPQDNEQAIKRTDSNLTNGVTTINEERAERGLEPVEWGDEPWLPVNLAQPSDESEPAEPTPPNTPPNEEDPAEEDPEEGDPEEDD